MNFSTDNPRNGRVVVARPADAGGEAEVRVKNALET